MNPQEIAQTIGISVDDVNYFLSMSAEELIQNADYIAMLKTLDKELLQQTLPEARMAYESGLPAFQSDLNKRYNMSSRMMSAYTVGNWVVGALQYPENTEAILKMHSHVPGEAVVGGIWDLMEMVQGIPQGAEEWQRALCALSLPLMKL
jgi:hypothetical protein